MATRTLRLTVSAGADRSLTTVMQPFVDSVRRARKQVADEAAGMGADIARGIRKGAAEGKKAPDEIRDAYVKAMREAGESVDDLGNKTERAAERARSAWRGVGSGIAGEFTRAHDAVRIVSTMVNNTWSNLRSIGTTALRVGEQITRGFGVNFDVSSLIQNGVQ